MNQRYLTSVSGNDTFQIIQCVRADRIALEGSRFSYFICLRLHEHTLPARRSGSRRRSSPGTAASALPRPCSDQAPSSLPEPACLLRPSLRLTAQHCGSAIPRGPAHSIAHALRRTECFFKNGVDIQLAAPAEAFRIRDRQCVTVVDLQEQVGVRRFDAIAADNARICVQRHQRALASAAAGNDKVHRTAVEQQAGLNAQMQIGQTWIFLPYTLPERPCPAAVLPSRCYKRCGPSVRQRLSAVPE